MLFATPGVVQIYFSQSFDLLRRLGPILSVRCHVPLLCDDLIPRFPAVFPVISLPIASCFFSSPFSPFVFHGHAVPF